MKSSSTSSSTAASTPASVCSAIAPTSSGWNDSPATAAACSVRRDSAETALSSWRIVAMTARGTIPRAGSDADRVRSEWPRLARASCSM